MSDYTFQRVDEQARKLIEVKGGTVPLVVDTRPPSPDPGVVTHSAPSDSTPPTEAAGEPAGEEAATSPLLPESPAESDGESSAGNAPPKSKRRGRRKKHTTRGDAQ